MNEITESFLQVVAGDIEKLLLENQEILAFSYKKIPDGIKVSMGISFDPSSNGIVVNYDMSFDLEQKPEPPGKHKVKFKHIINEFQQAFTEFGNDLREGRVSVKINGEVIGKLSDENPTS
jgi:hypothetical protein